MEKRILIKLTADNKAEALSALSLLTCSVNKTKDDDIYKIDIDVVVENEGN